MKKLLLIIAVISIAACSKDETADTPANCPIDMSLFKDITWQPPTGTPFATVRFESNYNYYEDSTLDGTWSVSNGCDSIYITRTSSSFFYRIIFVSSDTLKLRNPVFGDVFFHK